MNIPLPEKRRLRISEGTLDAPTSKIEYLTSSHPFTQQIDVVFPKNLALEASLSKLQTRYAKGKAKISDVISNSAVFVNSVSGESNVLILSSNQHEEDVWCVDPRGVLTLSVSKNTYETLGLTGKKLPFKSHSDQYAIHIPLQRNTESAKVQAKQKALLEAWDTKRSTTEKGLGLWEVVYCSTGADPDKDPDFTASECQLQPVNAENREVANVHIPVPSFAPRPVEALKTGPVSEFGDELDDWNSEVSELFEWVGLACLQAQRINANDRIDPFVALYEPPHPSRIGAVTVLRWRGLLSPSFIQLIMDTALNSISSTAHSDGPKDGRGSPFLAITCHGIPTSPVSYVPFVTRNQQPSIADTPPKVPRSDADDTWSWVVGSAPSGELRWILGESLGQWDTRWG